MTASQATDLPAAAAHPSANPYVGPRTFTEAEGRYFFGREREARDLTARIVSERLLLFYAQSGAGKSSLLNTRVIPKLRDEERFQMLPVGRVSGELPAGVAQVDNIYAFNLMASLDQSAAHPGRLAKVTLSDFLARLARAATIAPQGQRASLWAYRPEIAVQRPDPNATQPRASPRFALIIDQFEEIITGHPGRWRERERFFRQLNQALLDDPNLWVVLTLREDYVASLDPYAELCFNRLRARFYMERMGVAAALDAVRKPAELAGRPFAAAVAEQLVDNLRQVRIPGQEATVPGQYVEPVQLQVVCYQLWKNLGRGEGKGKEGKEGREGKEGGEITLEDLAVAGDVDRALTQFYEETLAAALADPAAAGVSERQLRAWFDGELITEAGTRGLVRQGAADTSGLPNGLVAALQRRFLVRGEARSGGTWIELVHDRFVEPIRQSNRAWFSHNLNRLTVDARAWQEAGAAESKLYKDTQLAAAAAQIQANPADFGELERAFVEAGQKAEARRAAHRQRRIAWGAATLALVFIALAAWALWSRGQIRVEAQRAAAAEAKAITQKGTAEAASTGVALALAAAQAANTAQVRAMSELEGALQANLTVLAGAEQTATLTATPRPGPARTLTPTPTAPTPTANPLVAAQQTQLAAVRATQTALAEAQSPIQSAIERPTQPLLACGLKPGPTFAGVWDSAGLGCPTTAQTDATTAYERFERGWMLWRKDNDRIYAFFDGGEYRSFVLPPDEPRPEFSCPEAESLGNPRLGFGRIWCNDLDVRQRLGKPLTPEVAAIWPLQDFAGGFMLYLAQQNDVVAAYHSGQWAVAR